MPHRAAAKKSLRQNRKRQLRNKMIKSRLRTEQTRFDRMIERGDVEAASQQISLLTKLYHRAAARTVIHPNLAARKQTQAQGRLNNAREQAATY